MLNMRSGALREFQTNGVSLQTEDRWNSQLRRLVIIRHMHRVCRNTREHQRVRNLQLCWPHSQTFAATMVLRDLQRCRLSGQLKQRRHIHNLVHKCR